jgi:endonuclease-8
MEGAWHVYRLGSAWRRPGHTARAVLDNEKWQAVGYSLGILEVLPRTAEESVVGHLGPDLLGPDWDLDEAARRVTADPDRPVFLALLDQRNVAGFGNEYTNELLFLMGLLPTRPVGEVTDIRRVLSRGRQMLDLNKSRIDRSFTGSTRTGEDRWVYRRERARCRRCGTPLRTGTLGDRPTAERNTFWCPRCLV